MKNIIFTLLLSTSLLLLPVEGFAQDDADELRHVFVTALERNPDIQAALASVNIAKGNLLQARLRPNPEATVEMENFGGNDQFSGTGMAEVTYGIEQELEIGGKRRYRREVANYELQITQEQTIADILGILANIHQAYAELNIAHQRLNLAEKRLELANKTHLAVKGRVKAAAASDIQHTKVDIEQQAAEIEKTAALEIFDSSKARFERLLSGNVNELGLQYKPLLTVIDLPEKEDLLVAIQESPLALIAGLKRLQSKSRIDLARANAIPNPRLGLGVRRFNETNSNALIASISIPLPFFNRNQGNIASERAKSFKAEYEAEAAILSLKESAELIYAQILAASNAVKRYQDEIIPSALRAYNQASEGYGLGRFSFLELLDAQRTLYEMQEAHLNSLLQFHQAQAQVDFLMSAHAGLIQQIISLK